MFFRLSDHEIVHVFYPLGSHKNRDWWEFGTRQDPARDSVVVPMDEYYGNITVWERIEKSVFPILDLIDFDYICLGNGTDPAHVALIKRYGRERILFSEYGWLPWSQHFYISRSGASARSDIALMSEADIAAVALDQTGITRFCASLNSGEPVPQQPFIYMPLQKDVNDFKFLDNDFENNIQYLKFVDNIVPQNYTIFVKCHPLYRNNYDLSFSNRMTDITDLNYNKYQIYTNMRAMICLNSTSVLEALSFGGRVFTYGDDLFTGKGVTHHKVATRTDFADLMEDEPNCTLQKKFVSLLLSRQINRARCFDLDADYVLSHYWNQCL